MEEGVIVLTVLPQDNLSKLRPALIVKKLPAYDDYLVCGISTQLHQYIPGFDIMIKQTDKMSLQTGLKRDSIIRVSSLAVISDIHIAGSIGKIDTYTHRLLLQQLSDYLLSS